MVGKVRIASFIFVAAVTLCAAVFSVIAGVAAATRQYTGVGVSFSNYLIEYIGTADNKPETAESLITADGSINEYVARSLVSRLAEAERRTERETADGGTWNIGYTESHAGDFSELVTEGEQSGQKSGAVYVKLFPTVLQQDNNDKGFLSALTSGWYQAVYRSTGDGKDILTLYAADAYRHGSVNTAYSESDARAMLLSDFKKLTELEYFSQNNIADYFAAPSDLPQEWQSSVFQTGTNGNGQYYLEGTKNTLVAHYTLENGDPALGLGASGYANDATYFGLNNGMDTAGAGIKNAETCYDDLIFIPSMFETVFMGQDKDNAGGESYTYPDGLLSAPVSLRHGLWQLNGFDKAHNSDYVHLRSSRSIHVYNTCGISANGMGADGAVSRSDCGQRVAFHLDLNKITPVTDEYTALENLVSAGGGLTADYYTADTMTSVESAVGAADLVLDEVNPRDSTSAVIERINDAKNNLQTAIGGLAVEAEAAELAELKTEILNSISNLADTAADKVQSGYTGESWSCLSEAVEHARLLGTGSALYDCEMVLKRLQNAVDGLVQKPPQYIDTGDFENSVVTIEPIWWGIIGGGALSALGVPVLVYLAVTGRRPAVESDPDSDALGGRKRPKKVKVKKEKKKKEEVGAENNNESTNNSEGTDNSAAQQPVSPMMLT